MGGRTVEVARGMTTPSARLQQTLDSPSEAVRQGSAGQLHRLPGVAERIMRLCRNLPPSQVRGLMEQRSSYPVSGQNPPHGATAPAGC